MSLAKIYKVDKKRFLCKIQNDSETGLWAVASGNIAKGEKLVVGDLVHLEETNGTHKIVELLPRNNEIYRFNLREGKKKVTAANCDYLVIVSSGENPVYRPYLVDRYLVRAEQWEVTPLVVFNKMDLFQPNSIDLLAQKKRFELSGVECFEISSVELDYIPKYLDLGLKELKDRLSNKVAIFQGQSGVGKSKLITCLSGGKVRLDSASLGKANKGRHTTTWSEIVSLGDVELIDSPGIRSYSISDIPLEEFIQYFPDLQNVSIQCQFKNCQHEENSVGCAFNDLRDSVDLKDQLLLDRLASFHKMAEEIAQIPDWKK